MQRVFNNFNFLNLYISKDDVVSNEKVKEVVVEVEEEQ